MSSWLILIPVVFGLGYAIFGGIEFGLPFTNYLKDKPGKDKPHYFSPAWESTNILLLGTVAATVALFPLALPQLGPRLQSLWLLTAGLLILRMVLVLAHTYGGLDPRWLHHALAGVSLALPVLLVQNFTVILTSDSKLYMHPALAMTLAVLAVLLSTALWSGFYYKPGKSTREVARASFWLAALVATVSLPLAFTLDPDVSGPMSLVQYWEPIMAGLLIGIVCLMTAKRRRYFAASVALTAGVAGTLLWLILPTMLYYAGN